MRCALQLARGAGGRLQVIGIPKTIDNDIRGTDHTPGYGSVARFFAHAARDLGADNEALPSPVTVLETLGRDTGWVTAATVLARSRPDDAPHLIYLPERAVPLERIFSDVEDTVRRLGRCVIAVCEGQRDERGGVFGADVQVDRDGIPRLASNLGHTLALLIQQKTGLRTRSEKPGLVGRCFALTTSERDRADAELCGRAAAAAALEGQSEVMVALTSCAGETTLAGLEEAGGGLRNFPQEWMSGDQGEPNEVYRAWAKELAGTVPERARLEDL
jgi:6-phosphofructokinase 1